MISPGLVSIKLESSFDKDNVSGNLIGLFLVLFNSDSIGLLGSKVNALATLLVVALLASLSPSVLCARSFALESATFFVVSFTLAGAEPGPTIGLLKPPIELVEPEIITLLNIYLLYSLI